MKKIISIKFLFILSLFTFVFTSCDDDDHAFVPEEPTALINGSADFSNYVAIGNSLTAGYTDGALFIAAQDNSMPNLIAQKFAMNGGGDFSLPYMNDNIGGALLGGNVIQQPRLFFNGAGPVRLNATPTTEISNVSPGPYNNMGVPGAKSFHLLANGYGNVAGVATGQANPYFARMASASNASVMEDVVAQNPSFFTLWIGSNDVLSYAIGGGTGTNQLGNFDPSTYGSQDITDPNVFTGTYTAILNAVTANGSKGVILNLPYVTLIPYFTTVPHNAIPLDAATADILNQAFAVYNGGLVQVEGQGGITTEERIARTINFVEGQNAVTMVDEYLTDLSGLGLPSYRHATEDDLLILPSSSFLGTTVNNDPTLINGVSVPLNDNWILSKDEIPETTTAIDAFNTSISQLATQFDLAFVDANQIMKDIATGGLQFDGFSMNSSLVFGNTFSLDGVHPTTRGNAFIANKILMAIDAKYGSNFEGSNNLLKAIDYTTNYPESL